MPTPPTDAEPKAPTTIKVRVPQDSGTIRINTFDTPKPYSFNVNGGVIDAATQAEADLLVARVDGASLV